MNTVNLNLARKWRSKNFDQIIGQDLSVKMLKNSLYLGSYFPVYLFSGQRGCGKTSLARIFASAINCDVLSAFQQKPTMQPIPCLECQSCSAMRVGNHPDFVEIDAASHTGVDMIRQVIDASNFLPVMGVKKVYLIDEAHMLSKASFNALLKVLEEPSPSVLFILATTDSQKIIDTVRSRCFQLFFKSIGADLLVDHLQEMCEKERIAFERDGLQLIVDETEGSARDAINMLEQVRFSSSIVNKSAVLHLLGHISDQNIVELFDTVLYKRPAVLLQFLQKNQVERSSVEFLYHRFSQIVRAALWLKHGVEPEIFKGQLALISNIIALASVSRLNDILDLLCRNELVFQKTTAKYSLLEMILLQICQKNSGINTDIGDPSNTPSTAIVDSQAPTEEKVSAVFDQVDEDSHNQEPVGEDEQVAQWRSFIGQIATLNDPILVSVFTQGFFIAREGQVLQVAFSKELLFFKDWLDKTMVLWQPLLNESFHGAVQLEPLFTLEKKERPSLSIDTTRARVENKRPIEPIKRVEHAKQYARPYATTKPFKAQSVSPSREPECDISDLQMWQTTNMILRYFPGIVTENKRAGSAL